MSNHPNDHKPFQSSFKSITIPGEDGNVEFTIRVLTLNCWGLWWVAKLRPQRIRGIVRFIRENNCDIVFLQEVWVPSDFEFIQNNTRDIYQFAHHFKSGSFLKSSGIVILCKWQPRVIHFEPYSLNGSPFYFWHGDWFAGKGVAYSRVDLDGLSLHLFSTHTHAYYKENETVHDQYSIHRVCQAYQLARFINFISDTACNRSNNSIDLIIVAGDFNSTSAELPYKVLTTVADLTDCFKISRYHRTNSNIIHTYKMKTRRQDIYYQDDCSIDSDTGESSSFFRGKKGDSFILEEYRRKIAHLLFDSDTEDEDATYCHPKNTFTGSKASSKVTKSSTIKFDNTASDSRINSSDNQSSDEINNMNVRDDESRIKSGDVRPSKSRSHMKRIDFILCRLLTHGRCVIDRIDVHGRDPTLDCSLSDHEPVMVELKISHHDDSLSASNITSYGDPSSGQTSSSHMFDTGKDDMSKLEQTTQSKVPLENHFPIIQTYHECNVKVMEEFQDILLQYYQNNGRSRLRLLCCVISIFVISMPIITYYTVANDVLPPSTIVFMWLFAFILVAFGILAAYVSHRIEQSAVEAMLSDLTCRISVARYHQKLNDNHS